MRRVFSRLAWTALRCFAWRLFAGVLAPAAGGLPRNTGIRIRAWDGRESLAFPPSPPLGLRAGVPLYEVALVVPAASQPLDAEGSRLRFARVDAISFSPEEACSLSGGNDARHFVTGAFSSPDGAGALRAGGGPALLFNVTPAVPLVFLEGGRFVACFSSSGESADGSVEVLEVELSVAGAYNVAGCVDTACRASRSYYCHLDVWAASGPESCAVHVDVQGAASRLKVANLMVAHSEATPANCSVLPSIPSCFGGDGASVDLCSHGDRYIDLRPAGSAVSGLVADIALQPAQGDAGFGGAAPRGHSLAVCYCTSPATDCGVDAAYTQQIGIVLLFAAKACAVHDSACTGDGGDFLGLRGFGGVAMDIPWLLVVLCPPGACHDSVAGRMKLADAAALDSAAVSSKWDGGHGVCRHRSQSVLHASPPNCNGPLDCHMEGGLGDAQKVFGRPSGIVLRRPGATGHAALFARGLADSPLLDVCFCSQNCEEASAWHKVGDFRLSPFSLAGWESARASAARPLGALNVPGLVGFSLVGRDADSLGFVAGGQIILLKGTVTSDAECDARAADPDVEVHQLAAASADAGRNCDEDWGNASNCSELDAGRDSELAPFAWIAGTSSRVGPHGGSVVGRRGACLPDEFAVGPRADPRCARLEFDGGGPQYALVARTPGVRAVCYCAAPQDCTAPEAAWMLVARVMVRGPTPLQEWTFPTGVRIRLGIAGVGLSCTDALRIAAPGEKCIGEPRSAATGLFVGCPACTHPHKRVGDRLSAKALAHDAVQCDEANEMCQEVPLETAFLEDGVLQLTFKGDPGLVTGDTVVLGPEMACTNGCSEYLLNALRGIYPYGDDVGRDNGTTPLERELGHVLAQVGDATRWATQLHVSEPLPTLDAAGASWRRHSHLLTAEEVMATAAAVGGAFPVCWGPENAGSFVARAGMLSFYEAPTMSRPPTLTFTASEVGSVAPIVLHFSPSFTKAQAETLDHHSTQTELVLRFVSPELLAPVPDVDAAASAGVALPAVRRGQAMQRFCGRWLTEAWADTAEGFPPPRACSFTDETAFAREITIHMDGGRGLQRTCRPLSDRIVEHQAGFVAPKPCGFQLVLNAELKAVIPSAVPLLHVLLLCRVGCGSPYHVIEQGVAVSSGWGRPSPEEDEPRLRSFASEGADAHDGAMQLLDASEGSLELKFLMYIQPGSNELLNTTRLIARFFLAPVGAMAWDVGTCGADVAPGHELSVEDEDFTQGCTPVALGLARSALDVPLQRKMAEPPPERAEELTPPGAAPSVQPRLLQLTLQLPAPRAGLGFFPARPAMELVAWLTENATMAEQRPSVASFATCDDLLWRAADAAALARAFGGPSQVVVAGRSRYGPQPLPHDENVLFVRVVVFATTRRPMGVASAALVLELPPGFECVAVAATQALLFESVTARAGAPLFATAAGGGWPPPPRGRLRGFHAWVGDGQWEFPRVAPRECRYELGEGQAFYGGQTALVAVRVRNPASPVLASDATNVWHVSLHSRGTLREASRPLAMRLPASAGSAERLKRSPFWQEQVGVLGELQDVTVQPSRFRVASSDGPRSNLSVFFRTSQRVGVGGSVVVDAPLGFDFWPCAAWSLPEDRYDQRGDGERLLQLKVATCAVTTWPCARPRVGASGAFAEELCEDAGGATAQNRVFLRLGRSLEESVAYGFSLEVKNPTEYDDGARRTGWWIWTRDSFGNGLDGGNSQDGGGDRSGLARQWGVYAESLAAAVSVTSLRPYSLSGQAETVEVWFVAPRGGTTDVRITAPAGFEWGGEGGGCASVADRGVMTDSSPPPAVSSANVETSSWPGGHCSASSNEIVWEGVPLVSGSLYQISLLVRMADRAPLLGANAFFVELGHTQSSLQGRWAAAAVEDNSAATPPEPFYIRALRNVGVTCFCSVAGFESNHIRFSVHLPAALAPQDELRISGGAYTEGFAALSRCDARPSLVLPPGTQGPPADVVCESSVDVHGMPELRLKAGPTGWPPGVYAFEVAVRNPSAATEVQSSWTFATFSRTGAALDLSATTKGCPVRVAMPLVDFPGLDPALQAALGVDRRLGRPTQAVLRIVLTRRLQRSARSRFRVRAPLGFVFPARCDAVELTVDDLPLLAQGAWPEPLGECSGHGQTAEIDVPQGLEPNLAYLLRLGVVNPSAAAWRSAVMHEERGTTWTVEVDGQASEPIPTFPLQVLVDVAVSPVTAAGGSTSLVRIAFAASSIVPPSERRGSGEGAGVGGGRARGRLSVIAPSGFMLLAPDQCELREFSRECLRCLSARASRAWCALTDTCSDASTHGPWGGTAVADTAETSCPWRYSSKARLREGHAPCEYVFRPEDAKCRVADTSGSIVAVVLGDAAFAPTKRVVGGRRYELQLQVVNAPAAAGSLEWTVTTDVEVSAATSGESDTASRWEVVDEGESPGFAPRPGALLWRAEPAGPCVVDGGAAVQVQMSLSLPSSLQEGDSIVVTAPAGLRWDESGGGACISDLQAFATLALSQNEEQCELSGSAAFLGSTPAPSGAPTVAPTTGAPATTTTPDQAEAVGNATVASEQGQVTENVTEAPDSEAVTEMTTATPDVELVSTTALLGSQLDTAADNETDFEGRLLNSWELANASGPAQANDSSDDQTATPTVAPSTTPTLTPTTPAPTKELLDVPHFCRAQPGDGCVAWACSCDPGGSCRLRIRGLRVHSGAVLRWIVHAMNPIYSHRPVDNYWHVTHERSDAHGATAETSGDKAILAESAALSWPVQPQLPRVAVRLDPMQPGGPIRERGVAALVLVVTPLRPAAELALVAMTPGFDFSGARVSVGTIVSAAGSLLHLREEFLELEPRQIRVVGVRLGFVAQPEDDAVARFTVETFGELGELRDVRRNVVGFRLPGEVRLMAASLRHAAGGTHPLVGTIGLPVRGGTAAWLTLKFTTNRPVSAGAVISLSCTAPWALGNAPNSAGMRLFKASTSGFSAGPLKEIVLRDVTMALPASVTATVDAQVGATSPWVLLPPPDAYDVMVWAEPGVGASPKDTWLLTVSDGGDHPMATNDGAGLDGLLALPAATLSVELETPRPPPSSYLRVVLQLGAAPRVPLGADLVVVPPSGWRPTPRCGTRCVGAPFDAAHGGRASAAISGVDLRAGARVELELLTPDESSNDTESRVWFALVQAPSSTGLTASMPDVLAWGDVSGAEVSPMPTSLRYASLSGLEGTTMVLTFRLDREKEVGLIWLLMPNGYTGLECGDAGIARSPPRWPMTMRALEPKCTTFALTLGGAVASDTPTDGENVDPVREGIFIVINATLGSGTWSIGLRVNLPGPSLGDEGGGAALYDVRVESSLGRTVDAANGQAAQLLLDPSFWRVAAPSLGLLERDMDNSAHVSMRFTFEEDLPPGTLRALRFKLPQRTYMAIQEVKADLRIMRDTTEDALQLAQESGIRITRGGLFLVLSETEALQAGAYNVMFPVQLPPEEPAENVWSIEFCSEKTCLSGGRLEFPLVGFSNAEEAIPMTEVSGGRALRFGDCVLVFFLWVGGCSASAVACEL